MKMLSKMERRRNKINTVDYKRFDIEVRRECSKAKEKYPKQKVR